ncbi:BON domain-containing protein [Proteus alimentorum]|uniref:BON domain-containing protein n=1 Tax=Proteus alimentorum TaxID=1973495 RepID=A0ABS0IZE8_9GAMM|nr:BON domain-containing protein [Proteus alimentorum]MBG2877357.1 BON domain-containing protein [Proteus alimentorum]MBG2880727.1 BON domain-containing protein [Proteus alimentorum]
MKQCKTLKLALVMSMGLTFVSMGALAETSWYSEINNNGNNTGHYLSDTSISNKIKDTLLPMQDIDSENISIRTEFGHVFLSGFVDSKAQEEKILQIIEKIEGVKSVDSDVNIKS